MTPVLFLLALGVSPQDTTPPIPPAPVLALDAAPVANLAPTLDNMSSLGAALSTDPGAAGPVAAVPAAPWLATLADPGDTNRPRRPRAVEYSDAYYTRLKIHQLASYLTVPLFVGAYFSGRELYNHPDSHGLARDVHGPLAAGIAGLFAVNTITGVWNLWDSRKDPNGRTRRWVHSLMMIAADAGFVAVAVSAPDREHDFGGSTAPPTSAGSGANTHRGLAIASISVALSSYLMMLVWK
jgi:hypothetical protein